MIPKLYRYTFIVHRHGTMKDKVWIIDANNDLEAFTELCKNPNYQRLSMDEMEYMKMTHKRIQPGII